MTEIYNQLYGVLGRRKLLPLVCNFEEQEQQTNGVRKTRWRCQVSIPAGGGVYGITFITGFQKLIKCAIS
jgi:hypothetical protein